MGSCKAGGSCSAGSDGGTLRPRLAEAPLLGGRGCRDRVVQRDRNTPRTGSKEPRQRLDTPQGGVVKRVDFWTTNERHEKLRRILEEAARQNNISAEVYQIHSVEPHKKPEPKHERREQKQERQQAEEAEHEKDHPRSQRNRSNPRPKPRSRQNRQTPRSRKPNSNK